MIGKLLRSIFGFVAAFLIFASLAQADDRRILIGGTGAALGPMAELAASYKQIHPEMNFEILPSLSSGGGMKALAAGRIDIALTARPPKASELKSSMNVTKYALTPVVLATSTDNPATGLSSQDLVKIIAGELTQWPDGTPVGLVIRSKHSAETRTLQSMHPDIAEAMKKARQRPGVPVARSVQEAANLIQGHKGGLGTASLSMILSERRPLKSLALDGVAPTLEAVEQGKYGFVKTFYMVADKQPQDGVNAFMEFVRSPDGAAILQRTGHAVTTD